MHNNIKPSYPKGVVATPCGFFRCLFPVFFRKTSLYSWPYIHLRHINFEHVSFGFSCSSLYGGTIWKSRVVLEFRYFSYCWYKHARMVISVSISMFSSQGVRQFLNICCGATPRPSRWRSWSGSTAMNKSNDLEFQGLAIAIDSFHYHHWIPSPRKPKNIPRNNFLKNR